MEKGIKVVLGLLCIPLLALGFMCFFDPNGMIEKFGVVPQGVNGLNTIRGVIGGLLVGSALMLIMGIWRHNTTWFLATAVMMSAVIFGRLVGVVLDGFVTALVGPLVVEFVILGLCIVADKKFVKATNVSG